jgi:hypothetical protein
MSLGFFCALAVATENSISRLKKIHQIPCNRCAFYTGEYRLKCTVRPCQAFTEEAIACLDWEPKIHQPWFKYIIKFLTNKDRKYK